MRTPLLILAAMIIAGPAFARQVDDDGQYCFAVAL
jgi:hypothetical protein